MIETHKLDFATQGEDDILNITEKIQEVIEHSEAQDGMAHLFLQSTTSGLSIIEWEKGILDDLRKAMGRVAPKEGIYEHELAWRDGNGHSHIRSAFTGVSLTVPFAKKRLSLGQWQQIVLLEFDIRARKRFVVMQILA